MDACTGKITGLPYLHPDSPFHYQWTSLPSGCQDPGDSPGVSWNASVEGDFTFTVTVSDNPDNPPDRVNGHESRTFSRTIRVNAPPVITIAKPAGEGEYVGWSNKHPETEKAIIKVYAVDSDGVSRVEVWIDGLFKGSMVHTADYWTYDWNTEFTVNGPHTITIKAFDGYSCSSTSNRTVIAKPGLEFTEISFKNGHTLWERGADEEITEPHYSQASFNQKPFAYVDKTV